MSFASRPAFAALAALLILGTPCVAAPDVAGRWEGEVQIPGAALPLIVDLAQDPAQAWIGSAIVPGLRIKGAALRDVVVTDSSVAFSIAGALSGPAGAPPRVKARLTDAGTMAGEFQQGGNTAPFALRRTGAAQVEPPPRSTAVASGLAGTWTGSFELGGYARQVTLTLANHAGTGATAELVVVGKMTSRIPVDLVVQDAQFVRIVSQQTRIAVEGRWLPQSGEIEGSFLMGPFESPMLLRRSAAATGKPS